MEKWLFKLMKVIQRYMEKPWYVPFISLLAAADAFVFIFPTDLLLITRVFSKRKDWFWVAFAITTGSALGALALAGVIEHDFQFAARWFGDPSAHPSGHWHRAANFVQQYGAVGVGIVSFSFIPYQLAIIAAATQHVPLLPMFIACWVGRGLKYFIYALLCAYAPHILMKVKKIREHVEKLEAETAAEKAKLKT